MLLNNYKVDEILIFDDKPRVFTARFENSEDLFLGWLAEDCPKVCMFVKTDKETVHRFKNHEIDLLEAIGTNGETIVLHEDDSVVEVKMFSEFSDSELPHKGYYM